MWLHINKHLLAVIMSSAMVVLPPVACAVELPFFKKDKDKDKTSQTQNAAKAGAVPPEQSPFAATNSNRTSNANSVPKATSEQLALFKRSYEQGKMFEQRGELTNAETAYLHSINAIQNTTNVNEKSQAQYRLAVIKARTKQYKESETLFRDAAPHIGENSVFFCDFAQMYYEQGRLIEAELVLKRALEFAYGDRRTQELLAISILLQRDRETEGMRYLKQALGEERALLELAKIYRSRGDIQRAKFAEEKAAEMNPQNASANVQANAVQPPVQTTQSGSSFGLPVAANNQLSTPAATKPQNEYAALPQNANTVAVPPTVTNVFTNAAPAPTPQPVPHATNPLARNAFESTDVPNTASSVQTPVEKIPSSPFDAAIPANSNEKDNGRLPQATVPPPTVRTTVNPVVQPIPTPNAFEMTANNSSTQVRDLNAPPVTWQPQKPAYQPVTQPATVSHSAVQSVQPPSTNTPPNVRTVISKENPVQFPSYKPVQDPSLAVEFVPAPPNSPSNITFQQQQPAPSNVTNNPPQVNPMADNIVYNQIPNRSQSQNGSQNRSQNRDNDLRQQNNKQYNNPAPSPESIVLNKPPVVPRADSPVVLRQPQTRPNAAQPALSFAPLPPVFDENVDQNAVAQDSQTPDTAIAANTTASIDNNATQSDDIADRLRDFAYLNQSRKTEQRQPTSFDRLPTNPLLANKQQASKPQPEPSIVDVPPAEALAVNQSTPHADESHVARPIPHADAPNQERIISSIPVNPYSPAPVTTVPYTYHEREYASMPPAPPVLSMPTNETTREPRQQAPQIASRTPPAVNQNPPLLVIPELLPSEQAAPNTIATVTPNVTPNQTTVEDTQIQNTLPTPSNREIPIAAPVSKPDPRAVVVNPPAPARQQPVPFDEPVTDTAVVNPVTKPPVAYPVPPKQPQEIASIPSQNRDKNENRSQQLTQAQRQQQLQKRIAARQAEANPADTVGIPQESPDTAEQLASTVRSGQQQKPKESLPAKQVITTRDLDETQYAQRQQASRLAPPPVVALAPGIPTDNHSNQSSDFDWGSDDVGFTSTKQVTKQKSVQPKRQPMSLGPQDDGFARTKQYQ
ncbi:MAG: hypothetical protein LBU65_01680 [Planctomycetaceae bacterium]|jgi:tetratricopeptide (TPR) repeat protein|nr:hypothetical protein [Planctomycetaceae bacterium]